MKNLLILNFKFNNFYLLMIFYIFVLFQTMLNFKFLFINIQFISILICLFIIICIIYFLNFLNFYKEFFIPFIFNFSSLVMSLMLMYSKNIIYFFIFFEFSILPIFFYMIYFGVTEKKMISSFYLLIYTSTFSMMFLFMLFLEIMNIKTNMVMFYFFIFQNNLNFYKMMMLLIFIVKIPMFIFHIWLPKAHVESSSFGSMILAGILLKLGSLGIIIFMNFIFKFYLSLMFMLFLMISSIYILILCFFINDLKMIIAYFSVSHMMFFLVSYFLMNFFSLNFCMLMMISHSISSPMLFFFCMLTYNNFSSRLMMKISSMFNFSNIYSWLFFIFFMMNISIPPTLNFISEILIFFIMLKFSFKLFFLMMVFIFISGLVSIFIICKMLMSKEMMVSFYFKSIKINNLIIMLMFIMYSLILLLKVDLMF